MILFTFYPFYSNLKFRMFFICIFAVTSVIFCGLPFEKRKFYFGNRCGIRFQRQTYDYFGVFIVGTYWSHRCIHQYTDAKIIIPAWLLFMFSQEVTFHFISWNIQWHRSFIQIVLFDHWRCKTSCYKLNKRIILK